MTKTKTFDPQSGKFLATIASCMPDVPSEVMQDWIENPGRMKTGLEHLFIRGLESKSKNFETLFGRFDQVSLQLFLDAMISEYGMDVSVPRDLRVRQNYQYPDNKLEFVLTDVEDLGIPGIQATYPIFWQADLMGLRKCHLQEVFRLLMVKPDSFKELKGRRVVFGTELITGGQGGKFLIHKTNNSLSAISGPLPNARWPEETLWLFVRKAKE